MTKITRRQLFKGALGAAAALALPDMAGAVPLDEISSVPIESVQVSSLAPVQFASQEMMDDAVIDYYGDMLREAFRRPSALMLDNLGVSAWSIATDKYGKTLTFEADLDFPYAVGDTIEVGHDDYMLFSGKIIAISRDWRIGRTSVEAKGYGWHPFWGKEA